MNNLIIYGANPEKIIDFISRPYLNKSGNEAEIFDIIRAWNLLDIFLCGIGRDYYFSDS